MIKKLLLSIATLGPIGYVRGSGTLATLSTLSVSYFLPALSCSLLVQIILLSFSLLVCVALCSYTAVHFQSTDPSQVVIDEALGSLVTFVGIPIELPYLAVGFILFRFFDISKCCGINRIETLNNGWGVMLDDVAAGILSNILLRCIFSFWS